MVLTRIFEPNVNLVVWQQQHSLQEELPTPDVSPGQQRLLLTLDLAF